MNENRKRTGSLNEFYMLGKFDKQEIPQQRQLYPIAKPANAASLNQRNKHDSTDINIKPQIHTSFEAGVYKPLKYLNARQEHMQLVDSIDSKAINNMEVNRIFNLKQTQMDRLNRNNNQLYLSETNNSKNIYNQIIPVGEYIQGSIFQKHKNSVTQNEPQQSRQFIRDIKDKRQIKNYSQIILRDNSQNYFDKKQNQSLYGKIELKNSKQTTIEDNNQKSIDNKVLNLAEIGKINLFPNNSSLQSYEGRKRSKQYTYKDDVPDFFRIMENQKNMNVQHKEADGSPQKMIQVISKAQGWITVTPSHKNRKRPVEKMKLNDASKVNALSPVWMQVTHQKPGPDPLKQFAVKHGVRKEANRTFLVEKSQPQKSIFSIGSFRHNVHSNELKEYWQNAALESGKVSAEPVRLIEWKEPASTLPRLDYQITPKIGSIIQY